jgi:tRNA A37 threonylcarbamoyladenosine biosynthesis protein TsaE
LIEWADQAEDFLPPDYLTVELHHLEESKRRIVLYSHGQKFNSVLASFKELAFAQQHTS